MQQLLLIRTARKDVLLAMLYCLHVTSTVIRIAVLIFIVHTLKTLT